MSSNTISLFLRHLALSEEVSRLAAASDSDLLAAYEEGRGQAAFSELMRRHGPMVLRTCRRVLGQKPDAEDAFQATFVLLARKAAGLRSQATRPLCLGGWLHRVAYRTAVNVSAEVSRRKTRERQARSMTHCDPDPVREATWNEVRPILDAELDALPADSRQLLVACYLQGKTQTVAAEELGLPPGSVSWRLDKARALLAERLKRRGIAVSASLLAIFLGSGAGSAGVPAVLLVRTVEAAVTFTDQSTGVMSENVLKLVKGALSKMKGGSAYTGLTVAGWVSLLGVTLIVGQTFKARADATSASEPPAALAAEEAGQGADRLAPVDRFGDPLPQGSQARLGTIRFRSVRSGQRSIVFTRDGRGVIAAGCGNATRQWEVSTGRPVRQFGDVSRQGFAMELSPNGCVLAVRGRPNGGLRLWETATGKLLAEGEGEQAGNATAPSKLGAISISRLSSDNNGLSLACLDLRVART